MSKFVNISLPQKEVRKFERWTKTLSAENQTKCKQVIRTTVFEMDRKAKTFASAQGIWGIGQTIFPVIDAKGLGGGVRVGKFYGPYVEWGTGAGFDRPREAEIQQYAAEWWTHKIWKGMKARPYLFPAWRIAKSELAIRLGAIGFKEKK